MLHMVSQLTVAASRAGESMQCLREEYVTDAEEAPARLQSVGAKVAHELKNPLASIKGLCQLIARTPESDARRSDSRSWPPRSAGWRPILAEYLSFSRPLEDLKPEKLDLHDLAQDVLDGLAGRADGAGVSLSLDGPVTEVRGDPRRLKEALITSSRTRSRPHRTAARCGCAYATARASRSKSPRHRARHHTRRPRSASAPRSSRRARTAPASASCSRPA